MQRLITCARLVHPASSCAAADRTGTAGTAPPPRQRTRLTTEYLRIARLNQRLVTPIHVIQREQQRLDALGMRVRRAVQEGSGSASSPWRGWQQPRPPQPEGVLARGYSIVQLENGAVVQDAASLNAGDKVGNPLPSRQAAPGSSQRARIKARSPSR